MRCLSSFLIWRSCGLFTNSADAPHVAGVQGGEGRQWSRPPPPPPAWAADLTPGAILRVSPGPVLGRVMRHTGPQDPPHPQARQSAGAVSWIRVCMRSWGHHYIDNIRDSDGEDELHRTAQYLARNVILYTHYVGEVSRIVDEHFSKALDQTTYNEQKGKRYFIKKSFFMKRIVKS